MNRVTVWMRMARGRQQGQLRPQTLVKTVGLNPVLLNQVILHPLRSLFSRLSDLMSPRPPEKQSLHLEMSLASPWQIGQLSVEGIAKTTTMVSGLFLKGSHECLDLH